MSDLKNKLIKLAYENPELRSDLLPQILKMADEPKTGFLGGGTNVKIELPHGEKPQGKEVTAKELEKILHHQLYERESAGWHGVTDEPGSVKLTGAKLIGTKDKYYKDYRDGYSVTWEVTKGGMLSKKSKVTGRGVVVFPHKSANKGVSSGAQWLELEKD